MSPRLAAGVVAMALLGHAAVLVIWPQAHALLIDLQVHRAGGEHVAAGLPLYGDGVLLDLPFVYPPFAAAAVRRLPGPDAAVPGGGHRAGHVRRRRGGGVPRGPGRLGDLPTGAVSLTPDAYLVLYLAVLAGVA